MMDMYRRAMSIIERICLILSSIFIVVMATVLMYQVIMRYFFHNATSWSDEVATTSFVWSVMLAIPIGIRRHEHVAVEYFINLLPAIGVRAMHILIDVATAATMAIIGYFAVNLLESANRQLLSGISLAAGIDVPMSWVYIAVPIGSVVTILFCLERIFNDLLGRPQWEVENPSEIDEIISAEVAMAADTMPSPDADRKDK